MIDIIKQFFIFPLHAEVVKLGRRRGLKILRPQGRAGSIPALGTQLQILYLAASSNLIYETLTLI